MLQSDEAFYTAYLQSLVDEGKLDEAKAWLAKPHPKIGATLVRSLLAGIAFAEGDQRSRVTHWQEAMKAANFSGKYSSFRTMLGIAERFDDEEMVDHICRRIVNIPPRALPDTRQLEFLRHHLGNDQEVIVDFYQRLVASRPDDPLARYNQALLQLVNDRATAGTARTLEELAHSFGDVLAFRCALALAYLDQGKGEEALRLLRSSEVDWNAGASDFERAAYASVERRVGEPRTADRLQGSVRWERMPPYLKTYLVSLAD